MIGMDTVPLKEGRFVLLEHLVDPTGETATFAVKTQIEK